MLACVMEHVAALAESREVRELVIAGVMVVMRTGQHDPGAPQRRRNEVHHVGTMPATVTPHVINVIKPSAVAQVMNDLKVRPTASFAATAGAAESHHA